MGFEGILEVLVTLETKTAFFFPFLIKICKTSVLEMWKTLQKAKVCSGICNRGEAWAVWTSDPPMEEHVALVVGTAQASLGLFYLLKAVGMGMPHLLGGRA